MFDEFRQSATSARARSRFRSSMLAAAVVYGSSSAAIVAATAAVTKPVEDVLDVIVWKPPARPTEAQPEPPPPVPTVKAKERKPRPIKRAVQTPVEVPKEKPLESDEPLAEIEGESVDDPGLGHGSGSGSRVTPPPPPPPPPLVQERLVKPALLHGGERPRYPHNARRKGIAGTVLVAFDVLEDGRVANLRVLSGPPELFATVLDAVASWRFKPAYRNGKPVRYPLTRAVVFRLEDS